MPFFSIVVPTYNGARYIKQTLDSLINQSFDDKEILVVDNGSTDDTPGILRTFGNAITVLKEGNKGSAYARNLGIQNSSGKYIVSFDSDDILLPYALEVYKKVIDSFNNPPLIIANYRTFKAEEEINYDTWNGSEIRCVEVQDFFKKNIKCPQMNGIMVIKRDVLFGVGLYQVALPALEDNYLMFRLGTESPMVRIFSPVTMAWRMHVNNKSKNIPLTTEGILSLIEYERRNAFPGGKNRIIDRRGLLGGTILSFMYRRILTKHTISNKTKIRLILRIILKARTILLVGIMRKVLSYFYSSKEYLLGTGK